MAPPKIPPQERFWDKVEKTESCWNWKAWSDKKGYGYIKIDGEKVAAYRFAYEWFVGKIPKGLYMDHLCRNTSCVNPEHLEPVTNGENTLRGVGITAINARKTHCKRGHKFTENNTYLNSDKRRVCRQCGKERMRRVRKRAKMNT